MPLEIARAMGVGGGTVATRKTELVADLTSAWEKFNKTLERSVSLSRELATNIKGTGTPGGGGGSRVTNVMGGGPLALPAPPTQTNNGGGGGTPTVNNFMSEYFGKGGDGRAQLKALGLGALQSMPTVAQSFEADSLRSMYNFYAGAGANDYTQFRRVTQQMGKAGLQTDPMDAMRAAMSGASRGLLPSLSNYGTVTGGAATFSNLVPGAGLQGGMQAMAALNQGRTVNMMRMIGVSIRDQNGLMRDPKNIADDLWRTISRQATGTKPISKNDIALSLQPGNALDSLLNQMGLSNDPVLRAGIINALLAKASGSDLSQADLLKRGIITDAQKSLSERQRASGNAISASAKFEMQGFEAANKVLAKTSDLFANIAANSGAINAVLQNILRIKGGADTFGTSGNGLGGQLMSFGSNILGNYLGFRAAGKALGLGKEAAAVAEEGAVVAEGAKSVGMLGKLKNLFMGGGLLAKGKNLLKFGAGLGSKVKGMFSLANMKNFFKNPAKGGLFSKMLSGLAAYGGMDQLQKWLNDFADSADLPDWLQTGGNYAFDLAKGAVTGSRFGGPWGALAGSIGMLGKDIYQGHPDQGSSLFGGLASGGVAFGKKPYIVGEEGPELFVPTSDGVVIPNHALGLNRAGGGSVTAGGANGFSKEQFAAALLKGLGVPTSDKALNNIVMWENMEGGNWHNSAKYNPLNTSYKMQGSTFFKTGKEGRGVQAYTDWNQGLAATIATLTGAQADARGYTAIIKGLKSGVGKDEFLRLLQASSWDAGHYKGGSSSSGGSGGSGSSDSSSSGSGFNKFAGLKVGAGNTGGLQVGGFDLSSGGSVNYGGVNVSINLPAGAAADPKKIAEAVKQSLQHDSIYQSAVSN